MFKRNTTVTGKWKKLSIVDGKFLDPETGEEIDVVDQLQKVYGDGVFSLTTSYKIEEDVKPDEEE